MVTENDVMECLGRLIIPETNLSPLQLRLVSDVKIEDSTVSLSLARCALPSKTAWRLEELIHESVSQIPGVSAVQIDLVERKPNEINRIKHVIAVMSGKGGVGKSVMSSLLAVSLKRQGFAVGILDADITGPSIPKLFGVSYKPMGNQCGFLPAVSRTGIEIMSINLVLDSDTDAVIWRGPLIGKAIAQFWNDVLWGELDYLVVDLPPGTSDAALTTMQEVPLSTVIMVTMPQALAGLIVRKAINMTRKMNVPVLGIIENMAYFTDPNSGKAIEIFGHSKVNELIDEFNLPLLAQFPVDPRIAMLCDGGDIESYQSEVVLNLGNLVVKRLNESTDCKSPSN